MKNTTISVLTLFVLFLFTSEVLAQNYAVSLKAGSRGVSIEGIRSFDGELNARIGFAVLPLSYNGDDEDYKYEADLNLLSISAIADWFPFGSGFYLSAGAVINLNKAEMTITPVKTYKIGRLEYTPEKLGNVNAKIEFPTIAPYFGIGFGSNLTTSGLSFTADIGTFYHGKPEGTITGQGMLAPMSEQTDQFNSNLDWFTFFPVVNLGLTYTF